MKASRAEAGKRVIYSEVYLATAGRGSMYSHHKRKGIIIREANNGTCYIVMWDGTKTGQTIAKSFVTIINDQPMANIQPCPTCGGPSILTWAGLDLVTESGDETLASKHYQSTLTSVTELDKLNIIKEYLDVQLYRIDVDMEFWSTQAFSRPYVQPIILNDMKWRKAYLKSLLDDILDDINAGGLKNGIPSNTTGDTERDI